MAGSIRNSPLSHLIVDPVNNGIAANVVSGEPVANTPGLLIYPYLGWADRPIRFDPTGTTVQPVSVIGTVQTIPGAPTTSLYSHAAISFSASGDNVVIAGVGGQTIRVYRIFFVNADGSTTTNVTIKDSTPTSFTGAFPLVPNGSFSGDGQGDPPWTTATGKGFVINSSAAVQISGEVWYTVS